MANYIPIFCHETLFFISLWQNINIMKNLIIGREEEKKLLQTVFDSNKSEFVAVCGRRRVGKTFLIREFFEDDLVFQTSGLAKQGMKQQIKSFYTDLVDQGLENPKMPKDWIDVFMLLRQLIKQSDKERKVVLLDELPWMDTNKSGFISALEHFWNSWASARHDIVLIVCGSATSWMMNKLINNHGGLYNRITRRIFLQPFTLHETEDFLKKKGFVLSRYDITVCYMIMGGIPFYLEMMERDLSVAQNINMLFFRPNGQLTKEFSNLYQALFKDSTDYVKVVEALSNKRTGLTRKEILSATGLLSGNKLTTILQNLESCGFIRQYQLYGEPRMSHVYQLVDFYTLFYYRFLANKKTDSWTAMQDKPDFYTWAGLTYELLVVQHIEQVKQALGIEGVETRVSTWRCVGGDKGAQIDAIIDRNDNTINICEIKFSIDTFSIDSNYEKNLRNKVQLFVERTNMKKSIQLTLITTYGLKKNIHSGIVHKSIILDNLFT